MVIFEVFLVGGVQEAKAELLPEETVRDTQAQIMTPEEAEQVGFGGLPEDPANRPRLFIACAERDERRIHLRLEGSNLVGQFRVHHVEV